jgi:protease-4
MTTDPDSPAAASSAPRFEPAAARQPPPAGMAGIERGVEQMVHEFVQERRSERRWRNFWRLAWLLAFLVLAWALFSQGHKAAAPATPHTALIEVRGEIAADTEASAENLVGALRSAFEDKGAQAIVLRINSPGGSPVQAGIIYDEIRRLRAKHPDIPMYAVVEDVCASGGYYIAAATDKIFVDKASIVGSIGVRMDQFGFVDAIDKLGVERRSITSGENKAFLDPFLPMEAGQVTHAKDMLGQIHRQFIDVVKKGRGNRLKESPDLFSGLFWTGEKSIELGLADGYGSLDTVARDVVKAETVVDYTQKQNFAERLAQRFGAAAVRAMGVDGNGFSLR